MTGPKKTKFEKFIDWAFKLRVLWMIIAFGLVFLSILIDLGKMGK